MKKKLLILALCALLGCTKKLDLKPNNNLVLPKTVKDFENLLDNSLIMNRTSGLAHVSSDEYRFKTVEIYESLFYPFTRAAYIWEPHVFAGLTQVQDWTVPYNQVFICNSVLDVLSAQDISNDPDKKRIKGWALFARAYAFYSLASIFAKPYDEGTASTDLGIPLKINSSVSEIVGRSSVQKTYDQIIADALEASELLQQDIPVNNRNRPSKVAAFALLARTCLSMRKYTEAEHYVDKSLALSNKLTDFNLLTVFPRESSFTLNSEETIYFSHSSESDYVEFFTGTHCTVDEGLVSLYAPNDLRQSIYIRLSANGNYIMKGVNSPFNDPFTGLATDEMFLLKAECLARRGQSSASMDFLNQLLAKRWKPNATNPAKPYLNLTAESPADALEKVLLERKKSLIYRGTRWTDLRRLNLEGRNITVTRHLGNKTYVLEPNSPKYVLPIPDDELALSGIEQNIR